MNKRAIFILALLVLFFASAYFATKISSDDSKIINEEEIISQKEETKNDIIPVASEEIKITPSTVLVLKKKYEKCTHEIENKAEMPEEMVNLTKEEVKEKYRDWNIEEFSKEEVVLSKTAKGFCGEHYLIEEEEGKVCIYVLDEENSKTLLETTDIAYEYLPETDKIILKNGIFVYGKQELNKIKEDYES